MRSILTEIYLCHACSCHVEILRTETPGQADNSPPDGVAAPFDMAMAQGSGGRYMLVIPSLNTTIVSMGSSGPASLVRPAPPPPSPTPLPPRRPSP
jgi:hypothetical protein